jgi:hypothetical protein
MTLIYTTPLSQHALLSIPKLAFYSLDTRLARMATVNVKNAKILNILAFCWWRWGELNPRPQALYRQFYILSLVI